MLVGLAVLDDGTARPLALALLVTATVSLLLVLFSERGALFGPPDPDVEET